MLVLVIAVLVVLAVLLTSALVFPPSTPASSNVPQSFFTAVSAAENLSEVTPGGPWLLHGVEGSDVTTHFGIQVEFGSDCSYLSGTGYDSIEPYTGNYSNGELVNWVFIYHNAKETQFLVLTDDGGPASNIGILSVSGCSGESIMPPVIPSVVIDTTQVAAALVHNVLAERFIASNPVANSSFTLVNRGSPFGWVWEVGYQTCQVGDYGPTTGNEVQAVVNATTGDVDNISTASGVSSCSGHSATTPLGSVFGLFYPTEAMCPTGDTYLVNGCRGGDAIYRVGIAYSQPVAHLGDLLLQVETSTGVVLSLSEGVGGFGVLNGSSEAVAESAASPTLSMNGWTFPLGSPATNATVLSNTFSEFVVDLGPSSPYGHGYVLLVTGTGPMSGAFSENLP